MDNLIVHISNTPLAGAPGRLSNNLQQHTKLNSICFTEKDYKKAMAHIFTKHSLVLNNGLDADAMGLFRKALVNASVIHIHNYISPAVSKLVQELSSDVPIIYHLHSPRREGPLYIPRNKEFKLPIVKQLVVAQMHPRFYPNATPVPNIVPIGYPYLRETEDPEKVRILYAPAEVRAGRWNGKACQHLFDALKVVSAHKNVDVVALSQPQPSHVLERIRATCDVSVDEIVTGGFHQVSLEGLQAGNAVINGADEISMRVMMGWTGARPPFVVSHSSTIADDLWKLIEDRDYLATTRKASLDYALKYLNPKKLIKIYENIYKDVIS